jgi:hypothetical protein
MAVTAAIGGTVLPAYSQITGVPGEALLVPLVLNDNEVGENNETGDHTYVQINVPSTLGTDRVLNTYTAPHVTTAGSTTPQQSDHFRIHWEYFNHKSKPGPSGWCYVSAGDTVLWTTDPKVYDRQEDIGADLTGDGIPHPQVPCGPGKGGLPYPGIGYVVFQTELGSRGLEADFAMEGTAYIAEDSIAPADVLLSVPVIPMVDGRDSLNTSEQPQLLQNEVINKQPPDYINTSAPTKVAPLAAGIRMNSGDGIQQSIFVSAGVQGNDEEEVLGQGYSLHAFWFDRNDATREAYTWIWDEHEYWCNFYVPLPWEVNVLVYNMSVSGAENPSWEKLENAVPRNLALTNVLTALTDEGIGDNYNYKSGEYCYAPYWDQTISGYAEYQIPESPDSYGRLTSAAVGFEAQLSVKYEDAWATSMMNIRGRQ